VDEVPGTVSEETYGPGDHQDNCEKVKKVVHVLYF
jgi:hypothetical protein